MAKKQTYADRAKQIMNKYKIRLGENFDKGDKLSLDAMNQELAALQQEQEQARVAKQEADQQFQQDAVQTFAMGGKLTKRQRSTVSELLLPEGSSQRQFAMGGKLKGAMRDMKGDMKEGVGELFSEIREGDNKELKALRKLGYLPHYPGHKALMGGGKHQYAYGGKIPQKPSLSSTGLAAGKKPSQYSEQQLRLGIDVEFEHTKNKSLAMKIAMDHLEENPMYYGTGGKAQAEQSAQQNAAADAAKYAMGGGLPTYAGDEKYPNQLQPASIFSNGINSTTHPMYSPQQGIYDTMPQQIGAGLNPQYSAPSQSYQPSTFMTHGQNTYLGNPNSNLPDLNTVDAAANDTRRFTPGQFDQFAGKPTLTTPQMPTNMATDNKVHLGNRDAVNLNQGIGTPTPPPPGGPEPFNSRVPYFGAIAQGIGALAGNRNIPFEEDQYKAQQIAPNLVDYSREREQFGRDRDIANQMIRRGAAGFGSRSKLMQNLQAGATGTQRQEGRLFSKSLQTEQNQNAMLKNQANQFNAQQRSIADRMNTQTNRDNLLINEDLRRGRIQGVTGAITGYGKDLMAADQYDQMIGIMAPENYMLGVNRDSGFRKGAQVSPTMKRYFQNTGDRMYKG